MKKIKEIIKYLYVAKNQKDIDIKTRNMFILEDESEDLVETIIA